MRTTLRFLRNSARKALSLSAAFVQKSSLLSLGWIARSSGETLAGHIQAFVGTVDWKAFSLPPRTVRLTDSAKIQLTPHIGEFDMAALFFSRLSYEREVFDFIESIHERYDAILEVGANVGVFTCFMSKLSEFPDGRSRTILSF